MSASLSKEETLFWQRLFSIVGFYAGKLDGIHGPKTEQARLSWDFEFLKHRNSFGQKDPRTENCIHTLLPNVQRLARIFLRSCLQSGKDVRILSGTRTYAEQNQLFRQGRYGNKGRIVTYARAGQSNHQFGLAWDVGVFVNGAYIAEDLKPYIAIAPLRPEGIEWGGDWPGKKRDCPHYQLAVDLSLTEIRERFEAGTLKL